jgi:osmoprotectant transport system ATP-binding protein
MIFFDGVTQRFGEVEALRDIDLEIEAGRTTVLIGPSGCGKSTLLRLVVGLIEPTAGRVAVGKQDVGPDTVLELRRRIGYVIQGGGLFPHLTAGDNVTLMARHLRRPEAETERRLAELCALTHFPESALSRFPLELSGGQQQRVGLMRALMLDPEVLLLDEPLGALDPLVRRDLQRELREIFGALHRTVLLVTHDLAEAVYLADRIVLLQAGEIVQSGTLDDLRERPAEPFVKRFLSAQRPPVEI